MSFKLDSSVLDDDYLEWFPYKEIKNDSTYTEFKVSDFLNNKLKKFRYRYIQHLTWKNIDDNYYIKMYWNKDIYNNAIKFQKILYENDLGSAIIDTFENIVNDDFIEYYIISQDIGQNLKTVYNIETFIKNKTYNYDNYPLEIKKQIKKINKKLLELDIEWGDNNPTNYVIDKNGKIRIVDYDDLTYKK
jgi:hypothetical protein